MSQESEHGLAKLSGSGSSVRLWSGCWPGQQSSEVDGAKGFTSKMSHSHGWQIGTGCCQKPHSVHCHTDFSIGILECPQDKVNDPREQGRSGNALHDPASEDTHHHFCYILSITKANPNTTQVSITKNKQTKNLNTSCGRSLDPVLEAGYQIVI